jgi:hypothetical protein
MENAKATKDRSEREEVGPLQDAPNATGKIKVAYFALMMLLVFGFATPVLFFLLNLITEKETAALVLSTTGWVVALFILALQLEHNRGQNVANAKRELRLRTNVQAFEAINHALAEFINVLSRIHASYNTLPTMIETLATNEATRKLVQKRIRTFRLVAPYQQSQQIFEAQAALSRAFEAYQVAVVPFQHLHDYIFDLSLDGMNQIFRRFGQYLSSVSDNDLLSGHESSNFKSHCAAVADEVLNLQGLLVDFRIELMNGLLRDVFARHVPPRRPLGPQIKRLGEFATPEEVERLDKKHKEGAPKWQARSDV